MEDLSTKPFDFQQKVADCRVLWLAFGGRHHEAIEREMRDIGHATFNRRVLYVRNERGRHVPGWPDRFGWNEGLQTGSAGLFAEKLCFSESGPQDNGGSASVRRHSRMDSKGDLPVKQSFTANKAAKPRRTRDSRLVTRDFLSWLKRVSPELTWDWKYQQYVYKKLKRVTDGLCKRLMIFMPPRHGKSELVTQRYAAWRLKRDPKMRVVVASYNQKLANRFSRGIRRILGQDAAVGPQAASLRVSGTHDADNCPACIAKAQQCPNAGARVSATEDTQAGSLRSDFRRVNTESEWETHEGGGVRAVGVGAGITGFGADLVIIDDPVKGHAQAESATMRENVWEWFNSDIYTRLEPNGAIILIQTRWHSDDLAGRLLREMQEDEDAEQWEVIELPALAEPVSTTETQRHREDEKELLPTNSTNASSFAPFALLVGKDLPALFSLCLCASVANSDPIGRHPGQALCPERFDEKKLERIKRKLGTYAFSALYQQRPVPAEGGFFKRHWFKIVDHTPHGVRWKRGYDLGLSSKPGSDPTATARVGFDRDGNMYIDRILRKRMEYPEQKRTILRFMSQERETEHLIEESANGSAVIQDLRRDKNLLGRRFRGVRVTKSKTARALAWNALAEEGRVHLVRGPWNSEFITEACCFPLGTHDDQIDAVSLAVEAHGGRGKALHFFP